MRCSSENCFPAAEQPKNKALGRLAPGWLSPRLAVADVLRDVKAGSSKWINEQGLGRGRFEWQTGYGAFSVSYSHVEAVREYLANQAEHHRQTNFREEFLAMLKRHQIEFDERYVFEEEHFG